MVSITTCVGVFPCWKSPETEATYSLVLAILGFIPVIWGIVAIVAMIWSLVVMVIVVRQALDFTTGRAVATCIVGFIVLITIFTIVAAVTGGLYPEIHTNPLDLTMF